MSKQRRNKISEQFAVRLISMLESPAYAALSISGHRVISRLEIELAHHGGNDNGKLPVTYEDFVAFGIARECVSPAIREAVALGFVQITRQGRAGNAEYREPTLYRLTYVYPRGGKYDPPTDDWRKIETIEQAKTIAKEARAKKSANAIRLGKLSQKSMKRNKNQYGNSELKPVGKPRTETDQVPVRKPRTTAIPRNPELLSISGGKGAA
jgi:hypothetical protein